MVRVYLTPSEVGLDCVDIPSGDGWEIDSKDQSLTITSNKQEIVGSFNQGTYIGVILVEEED